jgi:hypothetical protein
MLAKRLFDQDTSAYSRTRTLYYGVEAVLDYYNSFLNLIHGLTTILYLLGKKINF